jgi:hypothetical protein
MQPRADSLLTDLAHRVRLPAQLLVVLERCTLTLSRTRCPSPSGGSRVDGGRGSGARREQTNAAAYSRLWWRAAIRAAFQHSSLPSIRRARPVARPPVRARAHSRTVCLTFRHRHGGRVCQSRRLLTAVGLPFLPLNETFAAALSSLDLHGAIFDRREARRQCHWARAERVRGASSWLADKRRPAGVAQPVAQYSAACTVAAGPLCRKGSCAQPEHRPTGGASQHSRQGCSRRAGWLLAEAAR